MGRFRQDSVSCFREESLERDDAEPCAGSAESNGQPFMNAIVLTLFVSLLLVSVFVLLWLAASQGNRGFRESDALLPLQKDTGEKVEVPEKTNHS
jgi:hypothetical protein